MFLFFREKMETHTKNGKMETGAQKWNFGSSGYVRVLLVNSIVGVLHIIWPQEH